MNGLRILSMSVVLAVAAGLSQGAVAGKSPDDGQAASIKPAYRLNDGGVIDYFWLFNVFGFGPERSALGQYVRRMPKSESDGYGNRPEMGSHNGRRIRGAGGEGLPRRDR